MRLGVDFGTSSTVAMVQRTDGSVAQLLFDSSPLLRSAVYARADGALLTGADAERAAAADPAGLEPHTKRRIDEGSTWLGERELAVVDLVAAVLSRVWREAVRVAGGEPSEAVITHPATWASARLAVLSEAARRAGMTQAVRLVPEPVAAAAYFAGILGRDLPPGQALVVYDLGAGTFDVSAVRPSTAGFEVVATDGLPDMGGLDLDGVVVEHARSLTANATEAWGRLDWPERPADQRARQELWQGARAAKELLSRHASADLHVPLVESEVHLSRAEFEKAAGPLLERTVAVTVRLLRGAGISQEAVAGVFLVGGASRVPLAATLLHRRLRIAPTIIDQPELVVAHGCLYAADHHAAVPPVPPAAPADVPAVPAAAPAITPVPRPPGPAPAGRRLPADFPVQLVELSLLGGTGYTLRAYRDRGPDAEENGEPVAVFLSEQDRLPLYRQPQHAIGYATDSRSHALAAIPNWGPLSAAMRTAALPLADRNRYPLAEVSTMLWQHPQQWALPLLSRSVEMVWELAAALDLTEAGALSGPGSLLDRFDGLVWRAQFGPNRRRARWDLPTLDRPALAGVWQQLITLIESRVDWRD